MTLKLVTAILMTMATLAWVFVLIMGLRLGDEGAPTLLNTIVVLVFAVLSAFYWITYFRMKNSTSGTE
jgi:hypothetical protein